MEIFQNLNLPHLVKPNTKLALDTSQEQNYWQNSTPRGLAKVFIY